MAGRDGSGVDVILPNYILGKSTGIVSSGKTRTSEHKLSGHVVTIKRLNRQKIKNMEVEEKVRREVNILRSFMHPHIIRVYEVVETPSDFYVVMEHAKCGELFDYIVEKLNVCWKKIGHVNMKCKWIPGILGHHEVIVDNSVHSFGEDSSIGA